MENVFDSTVYGWWNMNIKAVIISLLTYFSMILFSIDDPIDFFLVCNVFVHFHIAYPSCIHWAEAGGSRLALSTGCEVAGNMRCFLVEGHCAMLRMCFIFILLGIFTSKQAKRNCYFVRVSFERDFLLNRNCVLLILYCSFYRTKIQYRDLNQSITPGTNVALILHNLFRIRTLLSCP